MIKHTTQALFSIKQLIKNVLAIFGTRLVLVKKENGE